MSLALLYANGTHEQKAKAAVDTYDENGDGNLFTNSVAALLKDLLWVSVILIPAISDEKGFD